MSIGEQEIKFSEPLEMSGTPKDLASLDQEREFLRSIWQNEGLPPTDIQAELPRIVGYVPDTEKPIFTTGALTQDGQEPISIPQKPTRDHLDKLLPETMQLIAQDLGITNFSPDFFEPYYIKGPVKAGKAQLSHIWHIDFTNLAPEGNRIFLSSSYLIASSNPTEFYEGDAAISPERGSNDWTKLRLHLPSDLEASGRIVQAAPFSIIRMTNLTVHRSPTLTKAARRSFMRVWCRQYMQLD